MSFFIPERGIFSKNGGHSQLFLFFFKIKLQKIALSSGTCFWRQVDWGAIDFINKREKSLLGLDYHESIGKVTSRGLSCHDSIGKVTSRGPDYHEFIRKVASRGLDCHVFIGKMTNRDLDCHESIGKVTNRGLGCHESIGKVTGRGLGHHKTSLHPHN